MTSSTASDLEPNDSRTSTGAGADCSRALHAGVMAKTTATVASNAAIEPGLRELKTVVRGRRARPRRTPVPTLTRMGETSLATAQPGLVLEGDVTGCRLPGPDDRQLSLGDVHQIGNRHGVPWASDADGLDDIRVPEHDGKGRALVR